MCMYFYCNAFLCDARDDVVREHEQLYGHEESCHVSVLMYKIYYIIRSIIKDKMLLNVDNGSLS